MINCLILNTKKYLKLGVVMLVNMYIAQKLIKRLIDTRKIILVDAYMQMQLIDIIHCCVNQPYWLKENPLLLYIRTNPLTLRDLKKDRPSLLETLL